MECTGYTTRRPEKATRNVTFGTRLWRLWNDEIGFVHRLSNAESSASTAMAWVVVVAECFGSLPDDWAEAAAMTRSAVSHLAAASVSVVSVTTVTVDQNAGPAFPFLSSWAVGPWLVGRLFQGFLYSTAGQPACKLVPLERTKKPRSQDYSIPNSAPLLLIQLWPPHQIRNPTRQQSSQITTIPMMMMKECSNWECSATLARSSFLVIAHLESYWHNLESSF